MKIKYFQDTDTLYIEFRSVEAAETRDFDENTLLDLDRKGNMCNGCDEYRGRENCSQKGFVGVLKNEPRHEYQLLNPKVGCTKTLPAGIMRKVPVAASHLDFLAQRIIEVGGM